MQLLAGALLSVLFLLAANWSIDRLSTTARSIEALRRDGYMDIQIIGHDCKIASATDRDGDRVTAWACVQGQSGTEKGQ